MGVDASYVALIHSARVLPATRSVLLDRIDTSLDNYVPEVMASEEFQTLAAMTARLLPAPPGEETLPFAAMIDHALHHSRGNGWRYSELPPDREAVRTGLQLLQCDALKKYSLGFSLLHPSQQDDLLCALHCAPREHWPQFPADKWFEEILAITTELFMSSPETYDQIGYSGMANYPTWTAVSLGTTEAWEPAAKASR